MKGEIIFKNDIRLAFIWQNGFAVGIQNIFEIKADGKGATCGGELLITDDSTKEKSLRISFNKILHR